MRFSNSPIAILRLGECSFSLMRLKRWPQLSRCFFHHVERYVNGMVDVLAKHRGGYCFPFGSTYYVIIFVLGNALIP